MGLGLRLGLGLGLTPPLASDPDPTPKQVWEDGQMRAAAANTLHILLRGRASVGMRGLAGKTEVVAMQEGDDP